MFPRLLLADRAAALLSAPLQQVGGGRWRIDTCSSAEQARAYLAQGSVDVLVADVAWPEDELLQLPPVLQGAHAVLLACDGLFERVAQGLRSGYADFVHDSVDHLQQAVERIATAVEHRIRHLAPWGDAESWSEWVLDTLQIGVWEYHLPGHQFQLDEPWCTMLGYRCDELPDLPDRWRSLVHPDDWDRAHAVELQAIKGERADFAVELRLRHRDGHWMWVLRRGKVVERDARGRALRLVGRHSDISARKAAELQLARQSHLMRALLRAQGLVISKAERQQVYATLLDELLQITESAYGFVGEVRTDTATGRQEVLVQALADATHRGVAPDEQALLAAGQLAFRRPDSLVTAVLRSAAPVIANDPAHDPRRTPHGLPDGHRPLNSYLGLPVTLDGDVIAVLGVANRPGGYSDTDVDYLQPLLNALADIARGWRMSDERRQAEHSLQLTLAAINQGLLRSDGDGRVAFFNDRVLQLLDVPHHRLAAHPLISELQDWHDVLGPDAPGTFWLKNRRGHTLELKVEPVADGGVVRTYSDVTEYISVQHALQHEEQRHRELAGQLKTILEAIPDLLFEFDDQGRYLYVGKRNAELLLLPADELIGRTYRDILPAAAVVEVDAAIEEATLCGSSIGHQYQLELSDGPHWFELSMTRRDGSAGEPMRFVMLARDITQRRLIDAQVQHLAYHDALTNLPNRRLLQDRLSKAISGATRHQRQGALLFIDLDNFKDLNDTLGHHHGDALLQQVATRLRSCVRDVDTVARLGGDEFIVMLEELSDTRETAAIDAEHVARKVLESLREPYDLSGRLHTSTPSIGVTLFGDASDTVEDLLKRADLAMYRSKMEGRNTISFFDPAMQARVLRRAALETDLRQALSQRQLCLYYQPLVDEHGRFIGAEALVRWPHPERGMVSPADFIPVAEQNGLIVELGQWVLRQACNQLSRWAKSADTHHWTLAVNVSAREFRHGQFAQRVIDLVHETGINPGRLKLEVTESMFLHDAEEVAQRMEMLRDFGIRFALDDFGTGYSSLSYLKRLPLDELKIDQSFVRDLLVDEDDAAIVRAILTLASTLGLAVVAEGVEQVGQRDFLARNGCRTFQGYLFGRPSRDDELLAMAAGQRVGPAGGQAAALM